jgi:hypothetical protein
MRPDQPHIFEAIPEVPIVHPAPSGPRMASVPSAGVVGKVRAQVCQICRRPASDRIHQDAETPEGEAQHWG